MMNEEIDVRASRMRANYTVGEQLARIAWALVQPLFRWSPRPLFAWRRGLLRLFGARVGSAVHVYPSARITMPWNLSIGDLSSLGEDVLVYNLGAVQIGARVTLSLGAVLCGGTHDHQLRSMPLVKATIVVGDDSWVCAQAFVGPGVEVGRGAIIGARAVAVKDVPEWTIVAGNPARPIGSRTLFPAQ